MDFWDRLNIERKSKKQPWRWLAEISSVPESTLSRWRKQGNYPSVEECVIIAKAVGRSVEYLVTGKAPEGLSELSYKIALAAEKLSNEGKKVALTNVEGLIAHFPCEISDLLKPAT